jgi:nicotinamidase-related amidase
MNDLSPQKPRQARAVARIDREHCLLLVVDVQERLAPQVLEHESVIARIEALISAAQYLGMPRLATEHCPDRIGALIPRLRERFLPEEIYRKTRFGAADHPEFESMVRSRGRSQIIVAGMEAHVCVMQTTLALAAKGFDMFVVGDAVGSRQERQQDRELALARMQDAGCIVLGTESALFECTAAGDDPAFRDVLALVKSLPE